MCSDVEQVPVGHLPEPLPSRGGPLYRLLQPAVAASRKPTAQQNWPQDGRAPVVQLSPKKNGLPPDKRKEKESLRKKEKGSKENETKNDRRRWVLDPTHPSARLTAAQLAAVAALILISDCARLTAETALLTAMIAALLSRRCAISPRCCPALSFRYAPNGEAPNPREEQMNLIKHYNNALTYIHTHTHILKFPPRRSDAPPHAS